MFFQLRSLGVDVTKEVNLLLLTKWAMDAKDKLLQHVKVRPPEPHLPEPHLSNTSALTSPQEDFSGYLERILEVDRIHPDSENEEDCIQVYLDIIQVGGAPRAPSLQLLTAVNSWFWFLRSPRRYPTMPGWSAPRWQWRSGRFASRSC